MTRRMGDTILIVEHLVTSATSMFETTTPLCVEGLVTVSY